MRLDPALESTGPNRLGIYVFYDGKGRAASFVRVMLEALRPCLRELVVVVNGIADDESRALFERVADRVLVRENEGLDIAGYQHAMKVLGWSHLMGFDEVLLTNDTILGPVYPLGDVFRTMDGRDVDFWGMTAYPADKPFGGKLVPTHLQSFWHVYRRSLVASEAFQTYWDGLPVFRDYASATHEHEIPFTRRFADLGFTWSSYVDYERFADQASYQMLYIPMQLVRDGRCPVFKRKVFVLEPVFAFNETNGQAALELFEYLRDRTSFDVDLIWDAILPAYNIADIAQALHLDFVLPGRALNPRRGATPRSAFICHVFFLDQLDETLGYLSNLPRETDLFITTPEGREEALAEEIVRRGFSHALEVVPVRNRGRDVSALLVGARHIVLDRGYEVVGFAHDKKSSQNAATGHHGTETAGFTYKLFENTLGSPAYVENVLTMFADEPRLGLLAPPAPFHALYYGHTLPADWGPNFDRTKELLEDTLGLHVPLDDKKATRSAIGSCYWFRVDALRPLFEHGWTYEDFLPEGVMGDDGSISHAIERANGFIAQARGYYPAWAMNDRYARIEMDSLLHCTNLMLGTIGGVRRGESLMETCGELHASLGFFRSIRRSLHIALSKLYRTLTGFLPEEKQDAIRDGVWSIIDRVRGRR